MHLGRPYAYSAPLRPRLLHPQVVPLRARPSDVAPLARRFLRSFAKAHRLYSLELSVGAARALEACPWPNNIVELRATVERAAVEAVHAAGGGSLLSPIPSPSPAAPSTTTSLSPMPHTTITITEDLVWYAKPRVKVGWRQGREEACTPHERDAPAAPTSLLVDRTVAPPDRLLLLAARLLAAGCWPLPPQAEDVMRVNLLDAFPPLREFVRSEWWPDRINFG